VGSGVSEPATTEVEVVAAVSTVLVTMFRLRRRLGLLRGLGRVTPNTYQIGVES
jgi:hypothetical protein